jgi:hypothetical protein
LEENASSFTVKMVGDKAMSGCFKPEVVPKLQEELY